MAFNTLKSIKCDIVRSSDKCTYTLHLLNGRTVNIKGDNPTRAEGMLRFFLKAELGDLVDLARSNVVVRHD